MADLRNVISENLEFYLQREKEVISLLASLPKGRIKRKKINSEEYFYLQYRKGGKVFDEYIGKKIPEKLLNDLNKRKALEKELKKIREGIKILRGKSESVYEFLGPPQKLFLTFTKEGLWDEQIEIIGAWCFILYQKYLPIRKYPLKTEDLNILIPFPYKGKEFDISRLLKDLGFSINFYRDGTVYFTGFGMKIEFLSPEMGRGISKPVFIEKLQITPQMLRYLNVLLLESLVISIGRGVKVRIPAPSAFFIHKLLICRKRKDIGKMEKDLKQAIYVGEYILNNEEEKKRLTELLLKIPKSWVKNVKKILTESLEILPEYDTVVKNLVKIVKV